MVKCGLAKFGCEGVTLEQFEKLMADVSKLKKMRTTNHEMRREYLDVLMAHPKFNEPGLKSALPNFLSSERKERKVPDIDALMARTGADNQWKVTVLS